MTRVHSLSSADTRRRTRTVIAIVVGKRHHPATHATPPGTQVWPSPATGFRLTRASIHHTPLPVYVGGDVSVHLPAASPSVTRCVGGLVEGEVPSMLISADDADGCYGCPWCVGRCTGTGVDCGQWTCEPPSGSLTSDR